MIKPDKICPLKLVAKDGKIGFDIVHARDHIDANVGTTPAVILNEPIYARNLSGVLRACAAWGVEQLWWTGNRITAELSTMSRLPREERLKGYNNVHLLWHDQPTRFFKDDVVPVCIELVPGATALHHFTHPINAIYVFGSENGSVSKGLRCVCHHFVMLPTHHCINLTSAVNVVLAHRRFQLIDRGLEPDRGNDWLNEQRGPMYSMAQEG